MHVGDEDEQAGHLLAAGEDAELAAELDSVDVVGRTAGEPDGLRARGLRLNDERGKILRGEGMPHRAQHLAAVLLHYPRSIALERVSERVIRGHEEPAVAAALDHVARRAGPQRMAVA